LGEGLEKKISEHSNNGEMIRAIILDKIGIVALDNINLHIRKKLENEIAPLKISGQLFPGENDFHIKNQGLIFDMLKDEINTITINKSCQLQPIKTVAVIFSIGESENRVKMCENCPRKCFDEPRNETV